MKRLVVLGLLSVLTLSFCGCESEKQKEALGSNVRDVQARLELCERLLNDRKHSADSINKDVSKQIIGIFETCVKKSSARLKKLL